MKSRESNLIKIIAIGPLIFIPLFVIAIILIIIIEHEQNFEKTLSKVEENLINIEKKAIKSKIDGISDLIAYQNDLTVKKLTLRIKDRVNSSHKIATNIYNKYKNTKSQKEIKSLIITSLSPLSWNNDESFIFILDYNGVFHLAPNYLKHLEGTSIIDFQDANGRFVIKEEIETVKTKNEGFLWDKFTKPTDPSTNSYDQVVFVKALGFYNLYLGSGEYLETASKISSNEILKAIQKISENTSEYIFVFDTNGNILLNDSTPEYVNKNFYKIKDKSIKDVYLLLLKSIKSVDNKFSRYSWVNPETNKEEVKYSYIKKVPNTNWIIGSGFYESTIKSNAAVQVTKLYEDYHMRISYILTIGFISILISLVCSYVVSKYLKSQFLKYKSRILNKSGELKQLNKSLEDKVKDRTEELEKSRESLEVLATTDALTKIHNRYSIMNIMEQEIRKLSRCGGNLCIALFDIDKFKDINDNYGHDVGDIVLCTLSSFVNNFLRESDIMGRYGGEEFLIIYKNTMLKDACIVSERVRKSVSEHKFNENVKQVTISIGLVEYQNDESVDELFKRLDILLYKSKNEGRNKLSF
ncbi:cache domain-containing protein [uncultured Arcobacter sp.]|uniref:sensor domain-containing diguanylate cyclase n=1 Tax=uncultured Arcobacter sp. TaxID=165434 RepID=UPI0026352694|nr:cache domain-containing protein [uncultured Arcobacter sp.]